jgi:hypothetical protein
MFQNLSHREENRKIFSIFPKDKIKNKQERNKSGKEEKALRKIKNL